MKKKTKKTKNQFVTDLNHLLQLIKQKHNDYALVLGGGTLGIFSRKTITYNPKKEEFKVYNHIDDTEQVLTKTQIMDKKYSNIGRAIPLRSLIAIIE